MEGMYDRNTRHNGAFRLITGCYSSDYPKRVPPERFVASRLVGGLKDLFSQLSKSKDVQTQENKTENGILHSKPFPNLAGRYKVLHLIGNGQSSILVAAEDLHHPTKKLVAIKIMNLDYKALGAQEADCIQQLNRADPLKVSRIVRLLNKFIFDDHYCMAFELLRPRPLHQYFQRTELDSEEEILEKLREVTTQILGVLGFLRRENVIHADLKPENILLESGEKMRIKVVDFGNAIRWVHQEMSLYYDKFELQTLLYRAPEVMFGLPFGPEIDMWSLGCIVAELYLGEPLFMGQSKTGIFQEMVTVLGPFPRIPFQSGKFYSEFASFISSKTGPPVPSLEVRLMKRLHNMKNFTFANFISGLLQYNPNNRLTPVQAASHPFLARHVPFAEFLTTEDEVQGRSEARRSGILVTPSQYTYRPNIDDDIRRQHLSSLDLLYCGTRGKDLLVPKQSSTPPVGRVVPRVNYARSKSSDEEDTKRHQNQGVSERQNPETQVTQGRVLQDSSRNNTQKLDVQKPVGKEALPFSSNVNDNQNDCLLHEPSGHPQVTERKELLLASKTKGVASLNIPVTMNVADERRCQRSSSEKLVDRKTQMPNAIEFDQKPCQRNDTLKDKSYNWLEGGMPSTCVGDVGMESSWEQTEDNEETSSARIRIYHRSKKPKSIKDSVLPSNKPSLSNSSSSSAEESSALSEGQSQASLSSDCYLPESHSEVEACRMSFATSDKSGSRTLEEYQFLRNTNETNTRSTPIKISDVTMSYATSDRSGDKTVEEYQFSRKTNEINTRSTPIKISDVTMSYATSDRSGNKTVEEYQFSRNTNEINKQSMPSIKISDIKNSSSNRKRTILPDIPSSLSEDFSSSDEITESKTQSGSSSKKNIKLHELEKGSAKKTTRQIIEGDNRTRLTPKRARRSLKLMYPHEDDEVNLL